MTYTCTLCGFATPADHAGAALMSAHLSESHPDRRLP